MPTQPEHVQKIRALQSDGLVALFAQVLTGKTPDWPSGRALEYLVLFTKQAPTLAQYLSPQRLLFWEGAELEVALAKQKMVEGLVFKYRHAAEYGLPDYNLKKEQKQWNLTS